MLLYTQKSWIYYKYICICIYSPTHVTAELKLERASISARPTFDWWCAIQFWWWYVLQPGDGEMVETIHHPSTLFPSKYSYRQAKPRIRADMENMFFGNGKRAGGANEVAEKKDWLAENVKKGHEGDERMTGTTDQQWNPVTMLFFALILYVILYIVAVVGVFHQICNAQRDGDGPYWDCVSEFHEPKRSFAPWQKYYIFFSSLVCTCRGVDSFFASDFFRSSPSCVHKLSVNMQSHVITFTFLRELFLMYAMDLPDG